VWPTHATILVPCVSPPHFAEQLAVVREYARPVARALTAAKIGPFF
jgi:hypothetical protein